MTLSAGEHDSVQDAIGLQTIEEPVTAANPPIYRVMILKGEDVLATMALPDGIAGDERAKAVAQAMASSCAVELWHGLRFVEHFDGTAAELSAGHTL